MNGLRKRMAQDLVLAGCAERTQQIYLHAVADFSEYVGQSPAESGQEQVRAWVQHLSKRRLSAQRMRQHFAALKFLYAKTLGRPEVITFLSWPRDAPGLPLVLSTIEISRLLQALREPKYRVFFTLIYATGLRLNEASQLETRDVDSARGVIHVRHGKGREERLVTLGARLLGTLRTYWKFVRPPAPWLFASSRGTHVNPEVARCALRHAAAHAGLDARVTPHVLRRCFATHLLETGTDLRRIQVVLGHRSIRTTARYAQVSPEMISKTPSPFDRLDLHPLT